ncbi:hypothetical protein ZHAS_00014251 [Anopheles sinensis]|uniref:Uncharacterized protein n=1 Tax=Anopheles sinensis TaxID=74873 RepID=A0A084W7S4_ANOSI|nr:hypothetical protein ZHAS_00014251 [Anopheles sinensis]
MSNRVRAREPPARTQSSSTVPRTMPGTGFSSSTSHSSRSSGAPIALATSITSSNKGTSMRSGHIPQSGRAAKQQRPAARSVVSRHFVFNHHSVCIPIVLLLIIFCGDFARLSGVDVGDASGGVLADELTTVPPEETWTTSSNENVGTGEAAPFAELSVCLHPLMDA